MLKAISLLVNFAFLTIKLFTRLTKAKIVIIKTTKLKQS